MLIFKKLQEQEKETEQEQEQEQAFISCEFIQFAKVGSHIGLG